MEFFSKRTKPGPAQTLIFDPTLQNRTSADEIAAITLIITPPNRKEDFSELWMQKAPTIIGYRLLSTSRSLAAADELERHFISHQKKNYETGFHLPVVNDINKDKLNLLFR